MNRAKLKKIVAREGLIFLGVFSLLISMLVWNDLAENSPLRTNILMMLTVSYIIYLMVRSYSIGNAIFPVTAKYRAMKEILALGMPIIFVTLLSIANKEFTGNPYLRDKSFWANISESISMSLVIIIPAYIIRFIVWAIKTLRNR